MMPKILKTLVIVTLGLGLFACAGTSPPTRYYLLNPIPWSPANPSDTDPETPLSLGVGPVTLPSYLDRPQIVVRKDANTLKLADFDRWGESLQPMFVRVLRENLMALLPAADVVVFPWPSGADFEYQVTAEVRRFDAEGSQNAILAVRWSILRFEDRHRLHQQDSIYSQLIGSPDYSELVQALNRLVEDFSRDVARAVEEAYRRDHGR